MMTVLCAFLTALIVVPCSGRYQETDIAEDSANPSLAQQRAENEKAYRESSRYLRDAHAGRWVVIVDGVVLASFDRLESASAVADRAFPKAQHRFVFRPGIDDGDEEFVLSPWGIDPNWFQLGRRFRKDYPLVISYDRWSSDAGVHTTRDGRGWVTLSAPGEEPTATVRVVCSNLLEQDLSITGAIAETLRLERFSVPGKAYLRHAANKNVACRRVLCRVTLDDLAIDSMFTAFVIPQTLVDARALPTPRALPPGSRRHGRDRHPTRRIPGRRGQLISASEYRNSALAVAARYRVTTR